MTKPFHVSLLAAALFALVITRQLPAAENAAAGQSTSACVRTFYSFWPTTLAKTM